MLLVPFLPFHDGYNYYSTVIMEFLLDFTENLLTKDKQEKRPANPMDLQALGEGVLLSAYMLNSCRPCIFKLFNEGEYFFDILRIL
jgi:hypothetical protein